MPIKFVILQVICGGLNRWKLSLVFGGNDETHGNFNITRTRVFETICAKV